MKANVYKTANIALQIALFIVAYGVIYKELFHKRDLVQIGNTMMQLLQSPNWLWLLVQIMLLFIVNWGIEAQKWRYLISRFENVSFGFSVRAVFAGVMVSLFTPNRTGEFLGRVLLLKELPRIKGILITIVGSIGQLLSTVLTGSIALLFFLPYLFNTAGELWGWLYGGIIIATLALNLLFVLIYLNVSVIGSWGRSLIKPRWKKIQQHSAVFSSFSSKQLMIVLLFSGLRVVAYTVQFFLLIQAFNIPLSWLQAMMVIPVLFLVMTIIPTIAITELGIRGSAAIYLMGLVIAGSEPMPDQYALSIVSASTLLWLINRGIPALLGTLFIFQFRFFRKKDG
ncbi:MAG TPA: lysylphosphatidylglycerol synthase transmembrane domain-containing protein [Bacteroidales bacterium]|nr:lysylphosphatidylglycerol synthase transmembrane domain-containing protein [Bacteroidales bacterium]